MEQIIQGFIIAIWFSLLLIYIRLGDIKTEAEELNRQLWSLRNKEKKDGNPD